VVPVLFVPIAPAGAQNAPGVIVWAEVVAVGVGVGVGVAVGVGVGVCVALGVGVGVCVGTGEASVVGVEVGVTDAIGDASPITTLAIAHLVIDVLRVSASIESTVRLYLYLTVIQFSIYPHWSLGGSQVLGSRSPFCLFNLSDTATSALGSVKSFA